MKIITQSEVEALAATTTQGSQQQQQQQHQQQQQQLQQQQLQQTQVPGSNTAQAAIAHGWCKKLI